jgi:hypothetical protein
MALSRSSVASIAACSPSIGSSTKRAERHVKPGGLLVAALHVARRAAEFKRTVRQALPERFTLERDIPPEPDHPVGFPQADYLKILLWRAALCWARKSDARP